ncbi:MAG: ABC transporter substrate-binding protein [Thermodesulfovibrionales bacterium]
MSLFICVITLILTTAGLDPAASAENTRQPGAGLSRKEPLQLGEDIYRNGILPSGNPVQSVVKGDVPVPGTVFTCVSCHMRSGLGSNEGGVVTPPTNGQRLFQPLSSTQKGAQTDSRPPTSRQAYTDQSLAEVLRSGMDPSDRMLSDIMPRYLLEDGDMTLLINYLKSMSAQFSPGVSDTKLRFATVIADDVSPENRDAMLAPLLALENYVITKYSLRTQPAMPLAVAESMPGSGELASRTLSLSRWVLKGPPETWRSQLEEYNRRDPVFALIGGITTGEWKPIHEFCEENQIPSLFPITSFPVVSETDWYTLYFSKGYYLEGEAAAHYISSSNASGSEGLPIQIVQSSPESAALAAGFQKTWLDLGHKPPSTIMLKAGETLTGNFLQKVLAEKDASIVLLWVDSSALPALESLAAGREKPEMVFVSSDYIGKGLWKLQEQARGFTYVTYPYSVSLDRQPPRGDGINNHDGDRKIAQLTNALVRVFTRALMDMRGNYYRDNFLDIIAMMADQKVPLYERLSFGPGQRYASKGCYIVQLSGGPKPEIIRKSDWVIH